MTAIPHYHDSHDTYHYTRTSAYLECAAREGCRRRGEPEMKTDGIRRGTEVHEGLARYGAECAEKKRQSLPDVGERIAAGYQGDAADIIRRFVKVARFPFDSSTEVLGIELQLRTTLPNLDAEAAVEKAKHEAGKDFTPEDAATIRATFPPGAEYAGTCDLLYKQERQTENPFAEGAFQYVLIDWKTFVPDYVTGVEPPDQLMQYAYLAQRTYPDAQEFRVAIAGMAAWQEWSATFWPKRKTLTRLDGDLSRIGRDLASLVERIKADTRCEPNYGGACVGCLFPLSCPLRGTDAMNATQEDAPEEWLRKSLWHDAQSAALKTLLKAHCDGNAPVRATGYTYKGTPPEKLVVRHPERWDQDLARFGLTRDELTNGVTKAQFEKARKGIKSTDAQEEFAALVEYEQGSPVYKAVRDGKNADPAAQ